MSFEQGACVGIPYHTAFRALFQKGHALQSGDKVLVHGASGGVGLAAVQLAKQHGLYVVGTAGTPEGLTLVKGAGADDAVNHRQRDYTSQLARLKGNKGGFHAMLEMLANKNLAQDFDLAGPGGRIVVIGNRGELVIDPSDIMAKELQVLGVRLYSSTCQEEEEAAAGIAALFSQKTVAPIVADTYSLGEAAQAHVDVIEHRGKGAKGNLVLGVKFFF